MFNAEYLRQAVADGHLLVTPDIYQSVGRCRNGILSAPIYHKTTEATVTGGLTSPPLANPSTMPGPNGTRFAALVVRTPSVGRLR
jgi:hypothetical protein